MEKDKELTRHDCGWRYYSSVKEKKNNEIYGSEEVEIGFERKTYWRMKDRESPMYACLKVPGRSSKLLGPIE